MDVIHQKKQNDYLNCFPRVIEEKKNSIFLDKETKILIDFLENQLKTASNRNEIGPQNLLLAMLSIPELNIYKLEDGKFIQNKF